MRKGRLFALLLLLVSTDTLLPGEPPPDKWIAVDKLQHFLFSSHSTLFCYKVARESYHNTPPSSRAFSATLVFSIGLGKEARDSHQPDDRFSYKDLVADVLGIGLGLILGHNLK